MVDLPPQWHRGRAGISSPNGIMAKWETRLWGAHTHCCSDVGNDRGGLGRSGGTLVGGGRGDPHARLSPGHRKALGYLAMYPHLPLANAEMSPCSVRPQRPSFNIHAAAWAHLGLRWRFGSAGSRAVPSLQSWEGMVDGGLSKSTSCVGETESGERGRAERKKLRSPSRVVVHVVHLSGEFRARVQRGQRGRGAARQGVGGSQKGWGCSSVLVLLWERNRAEQRGRRGVSQKAAQGTGILAGLTPLWDYLSLSRGGLGGVEHLLPPLHPRHGLHVLAPITHLHGALLPGGWDSGDTGWDQSTGSPTTPRPTAQSPAHGQPLPCCRCPLHQSSALGVWMWGWPRGWRAVAWSSGCMRLSPQSCVKIPENPIRRMEPMWDLFQFYTSTLSASRSTFTARRAHLRWDWECWQCRESTTGQNGKVAALGACPGTGSASPQAFIDYRPCSQIVSQHLK